MLIFIQVNQSNIGWPGLHRKKMVMGEWLIVECERHKEINIEVPFWSFDENIYWEISEIKITKDKAIRL